MSKRYGIFAASKINLIKSCSFNNVKLYGFN